MKAERENEGEKTFSRLHFHVRNKFTKSMCHEEYLHFPHEKT